MARDPFDWPFDAYSPFNYPIGSGAVYADIVHPNLNLNTVDIYFDLDQVSVSIYKAAASDPLRNVRTTSSSSMPNSDPELSDFFQTFNKLTYQVRIPDGAVPPPLVTWPPTYTHDQVVMIVQPDGKTCVDLFVANNTYEGGGNWVCIDLYKFDLLLDGYGKSPFGQDFGDGDKRGKHTQSASGLQLMGGIVRAAELNDATNGIRHALGCTIDNAPTTFRWPASYSDGSLPTSGNNLYYGSLLAIPYSVNLDGLAFQTVQGKNVAKAMQRYGMYIRDGGVDKNNLVMKGVYNERATWPAHGSGSAFIADLKLAAKQLKIVTNNGPTSIGGGGTPLQSFAPAFGTATANAPAAVTSLAPGTITATTIPLTWTNNDGSNNDTATSTEVWWKRSVDTIYTKIIGLAAGLAAYTLNPPLTASTEYNIQVYKRNATGLSNSSNTLTETTAPPPAPPNAPSGAVLAAESYDRVKLVWADNSTDEPAFVREVSKNFGAWISAGADLAADTTSTTYTDPSPGDGQNTYQMRVAAKGANGTSAFATSGPVTTPPKAVPDADVTSTFSPYMGDFEDWPKTGSTDDTARRLIAIEPIFAPAPYKNLTVLQTEILSTLAAAKENALYQTIASLTEMWFYVDFALDSAFAGPAGDFVTIAQLHDDVAGKILAALRISGTGNTLQLNSEATGATFPQTVAAVLSTGAAHTLKVRVKTGAAGIIEAHLDDDRILNLTGLDMTGWAIKQLRLGGVRVPASWTGKWWYKTIRLSNQDIIVFTGAQPKFLDNPTFSSSPTFPS